MYMREMGASELLTRAGEIEIAKRIEDGRHFNCQEILEPRHAVPGSDPGRQYWPDEGGGVRSILRIAKQPFSLETPVGDDADATLGDMIENASASSPTEAAIHANMRAAIDEALDMSSPREAKVLRIRFGLDTTSDHTLEEVGKQFDVTRERIRQMKARRCAS
ncbi:RNA polymerase sigma factor RpoD (plasmid) [Cupriavidus necator H850]|nr:RNA polymerase sigma factor RpoD [Cupriavidus necator H850]